MVEIDELDIKILKMLQMDGRQLFIDMAEKLKLSESTVRKRVAILSIDAELEKLLRLLENYAK